MITLSLDEYGKFESITDEKNEPVFIAGVLYDDHNNRTDTENERKRIASYYQSVIKEASAGKEGFSFPAALHSVGSKDDDRNIVKPVKEMVRKTIKEFLCNGTFQGKELLNIKQSRQGEYYIYAILKSDAGMSQLLTDSVNFLLRDNYASNLYFHMATSVISRMIFHNPRIDSIREVSLDIATRKSEDLDQNSTRAVEYQRQGYSASQSSHGDTGKVYFSISNADIYRTALSEEMLRSGKTSMEISNFKVKPINYHVNKKMEFLYLADSICSILGWQLKGDSAEEWLRKIQLKVDAINNSSNNVIMAYDEIDVYYQRAWQKFEEHDYYEALKRCYDAKLIDGEFSKFYQQKWFGRIEKKIVNNTNPNRFIAAVNKLHETLTTNDLNQERTIYILQILEKMLPNVESTLLSADSQAAIYNLYDIGVSAYCHIGDSKNALKYFNKCKKNAYKTSLDAYMFTINRIVVTLVDNFEIDKALKIAKENVEYQKLLLDLRNDLPIYRENKEDMSLGLCKAYSQLAQVYAFKQDNKCVEAFRHALDNLPNNSVDYKITQSYLLHYYLDIKDINAYESEATEYFGGETSAKKRFEYVLTEGLKENSIINYKYALYVYVRGVYLFEQDRISDALLNSLLNIEVTIKKYDQKAKGKRNSTFEKLMGHPSELIFKYIALIAKNAENNDAYNASKKSMETCMTYTGATIDSIQLFGKAELFNNYNHIAERDTTTSELVSYLKNNFDFFKNRDFSNNGDERYKELSSIMTFMYH
ncbi:hypothetical protein [Butyrivibrio sp. VCB2001]|uniref:hypothetical protein n=1 Tax=Butyrivibrio sp. VCB2001 TaxID=1280667 RepID=UPI0004007FC8|nr:hypothetical protein [Butyrivibrio sp. VCB2001]